MGKEFFRSFSQPRAGKLPSLVVLACFLIPAPPFSCSNLSAASPPERPRNVFLYTIDSVRADRFGVYGYPRDTTPRIDAWAGTGTVFLNSHSTSAWTAPGLVSVLSGLYPPVHAINNRDHMGSPDLRTLPKIFKEWNFRVPNLNFFTFAPYYKNLGLGEIENRYFGEREGEELINWLEEHTASEDPEPFFLWYHTIHVHQPYNPGPDALPRPLEELMARPGIRAAMTGAIVPEGSTYFTEDDRPLLDALYDAEVRRADELFGQALDILRRKNLLDDTLIILTADHGEELLDHGFIGHASTSLRAKLYEEIVRIPLIVSWPPGVPAGKKLETPVDQTDIFPTVLRLFGQPVPEFVQGRDLFGAEGSERTLYFESVIAGNQTTREKEHIWVRAVREGRFKYISTGELYDLKQDPQEQKNLLAGPNPSRQHRRRAREMQQMIEDWLKRSGELAAQVFPGQPEVFSSAPSAGCPVIYTPQQRQSLDYDVHTGMILFDWSGEKEQTFLIEYDIGTGDHHVAGTYEVEGNHQLLGPLSRELWEALKAWNPFRFRVSPKTDPPCWSEWVEFSF